MNEHMNIEDVIKKYINMDFWELVDQIDMIEELQEQNPFFKNKFYCKQLNIFNFKNKCKKYIVWGTGADGKKTIRLLKSLDIEIKAWLDSEKTIFGTMTASNFQQYYKNENIIIASRTFWEEIAGQIIMMEIQPSHIFEYNKLMCEIKRKKEFMKKSTLSYPPLWMTVGVTSACKNRCLFCAYHGEDAKGISKAYGLGYMLTLEKFIKIIEMAYDAGVPEIHICGTGEPFYNPDILKMIDYTIDKYGYVSLQTDFQDDLYKKYNYLDELIKRQKNISYIATDILSGDAIEHEYIKKGSSFKLLMNSLEYIAQNSDIKIKIIVILSKQNYKNIIKIIDECEKRKITNYEIMITNLIPYEYSNFSSYDNVYSEKDIEIYKSLKLLQDKANKNNIKVQIPPPKEKEEHCYVFWSEFQTWPVKGCDAEHFTDNMIPHACAAVIRGDLNSIGYLLKYEKLMDAWNNQYLVKIRRNMINGIYPDEWCRACMYGKND